MKLLIACPVPVVAGTTALLVVRYTPEKNRSH